ncbi:hypothetical protein T4D_4768 [Trichinella pseudospiralis]|uniref:Uncharacterized protein n=1 Tax=Trichinella pseudospiralis TaxID=6337 RepID=A0A0V1F4Q4_TRIPS|nr:hypothetical protein T4D_4768 [Trichinella pseudospiralis]
MMLYFEQHANHNCSQKRSWAKKCYRMHRALLYLSSFWFIESNEIEKRASSMRSRDGILHLFLRLKSTLMLNRGIRRLYMVALLAVFYSHTKQVQVLRRYFIQILGTGYFIMGHRRDIQIQKTNTSTELSCQCFLWNVQPAGTMLLHMIMMIYGKLWSLFCHHRSFYPASGLHPATLQPKVSMKVSERSQRVTVPEYCILRVGGYTKLGTSRSLKMYLQRWISLRQRPRRSPKALKIYICKFSIAWGANNPRATPGAKVLKNSEILKNCPRHSLRRSLRATPSAFYCTIFTLRLCQNLHIPSGHALSILLHNIYPPAMPKFAYAMPGGVASG